MPKPLSPSIECATTRFKEGYACSQAVFSAFAGDFGLLKSFRGIQLTPQKFST